MMAKMQQLTSMDQCRVDWWYKQAINSPQVRPFLQHVQYNEEFQIQKLDWDSVFFMDEAGTTLMKLGFDRQRHHATVGIYSLPGAQATVAAAFRFLLKLHKVYGLKAYNFKIHDSNRVWMAGLLKRFPEYCWGSEPAAAYDMALQCWVPVHHFSIPVGALSGENLAWKRRRHAL